MTRTIVIVGASLAGTAAAAALREDGFEGEVILVGKEQELPYDRPPLSKQYLRGETPPSKLLLRPPAWYDEHHIDLRLGTTGTAIDPHSRVVRLDTGGVIRYDKLLIATGGRPRRPGIAGLELEGIHDLRTVGDADAIRSEIRSGRRAVVVGMGFIGSEVTASLCRAGVEVVGIEPSPMPLSRVAGEAVGRFLADVHRAHGVHLITGDAVLRFEGERRVQRVVTKGGRTIECDFAVTGLGMEPVVEFAAGSAIEAANGIVVDQHCRTNVENVYAAGDVARFFHPSRNGHMRLEHWQHARKHGAAAARAMLGKAEPYVDVPWFWSDQYNVNVQYAGFPGEWDEVVHTGDLTSKFLSFFMQAGRVGAIAAVNRGGDLRRLIPLIASRAALTREVIEGAADVRELLLPLATR